jgi:hypothetical protein
MKTQVTDFVDIQVKAGALDCNMPSGVTVLPQNFHSAKSRDELYYESLDLQLRDAFRENGILGTSLEESEEDAVQVVLRESAIPEWIPPIIFVTGQLLQKNPAIVDLLLNIVSNFLYDKIKTVFSREPTSSDVVEFDFVSLSIGDLLTYKRARYKGSWKNKKLTDLKEFGNIIRKM